MQYVVDHCGQCATAGRGLTDPIRSDLLMLAFALVDCHVQAWLLELKGGDLFIMLVGTVMARRAMSPVLQHTIKPAYLPKPSLAADTARHSLLTPLSVLRAYFVHAVYTCRRRD